MEIDEGWVKRRSPYARTARFRSSSATFRRFAFRPLVWEGSWPSKSSLAPTRSEKSCFILVALLVLGWWRFGNQLGESTRPLPLTRDQVLGRAIKPLPGWCFHYAARVTSDISLCILRTSYIISRLVDKMTQNSRKVLWIQVVAGGGPFCTAAVARPIRRVVEPSTEFPVRYSLIYSSPSKRHMCLSLQITIITVSSSDTVDKVLHIASLARYDIGCHVSYNSNNRFIHIHPMPRFTPTPTYLLSSVLIIAECIEVVLGRCRLTPVHTR